MSTVRQLLAESDLRGESARLDAELLLCHCLQKSRTYLYTWPESSVGNEAEERYRQVLQQRAQGVPVAHLVGHRQFWSLDVGVDNHTLIPRPETELLVEWALQLSLPERACVGDLGTGSGAIALALASERPAWQLSAVDSSAAALAVARSNAAELELTNISFQHGHWCSGLPSRGYHCLVSNPPYIASDDPHLGVGDLRFEPRAALVSGVDGLDAIREIIAAAPGVLQAGGWLLLEHGYNQADAVQSLLSGAGYTELEYRRDLTGHVRASGARWHDH